ncbi:MAG: hypothetical protein ACOX3J_00940 [Clostridia bacterium]|jgi:hypothetical protein
MKKWILSIFLVFSLVLSLILPNFIIEGTENTIYVQNFETGTELDILSSLKKYFIWNEKIVGITGILVVFGLSMKVQTNIWKWDG